MKKNVFLLLKYDTIQDEELKERIRILDRKVQQLLLWSMISVVWSYMAFIIVIARIYTSFNGKHTSLLIGSLVLLYILMGMRIRFIWKSIVDKHRYFYYATKTYLKFQVDKLFDRRKLIASYLLGYSILQATACIFFILDVKHGLSWLLKLTAPLSMITYVAGFYFIVTITRQIKDLEEIRQQLNRLHIAHFNPN